MLGRRRKRLTAAAGLIAAALAAAGTARAAETATPFELRYEFYGAGFHLATLETDASLGPQRYEIVTRAQSAGFADDLLNARLDARATGLISPAGPSTEAFRTFSDTSFGKRSLEMTRAPGGTFDILAAEPELEPQQVAALSSGQADGALDPLTASIYAALRPENAACTESVHVFDGRRTFALAFSRQGPDSLAQSGQAAFSGPALLCHLRYVPIAGQTREWKLEEARDPSPPILLWLARFETPERAVMIPVRIALESRWGSALAHLTQARIGGNLVLGSAEKPPGRVR